MLSLVFKYWKIILVWGAIFALISGGVSLLFPRYYSAESRVLIIVRDRSGADPYAQSKLAEQLGSNLAQVMQTQDFYNKVIASQATFDRAPWNNFTPAKQRKEWQKNVQAGIIYGTNLLQVRVYSQSKEEAVNLGNAVAQTLMSQGWEYVGGDVGFKVVDNPLVSRWQTRPNILVNMLVGLAAGIILALIWVVRYKRPAVFGE